MAWHAERFTNPFFTLGLRLMLNGFVIDYGFSKLLVLWA